MVWLGVAVGVSDGRTRARVAVAVSIKLAWVTCLGLPRPSSMARLTWHRGRKRSMRESILIRSKPGRYSGSSASRTDPETRKRPMDAGTDTRSRKRFIRLQNDPSISRSPLDSSSET